MRSRPFTPIMLVATLAWAVPARAQNLPSGDDPLVALVAEALEANPDVAAALRLADAAAARVPQAGALPDPTLGIGLMNVPVANPSLGREMMTMTTVQVGARLPYPGKLARADAVAVAAAAAEDLDVEVVRRRVVAEVKNAYYRIWFLDRAIEVTRRNLGVLGDLASITAARYRVGESGQPHVLRAQVERARLSQHIESLRGERSAALSESERGDRAAASPVREGAPTSFPSSGTAA